MAIDLHPESCECASCTYQPGDVNLEADTFINRYLLEDLDNLTWSVHREVSKYQRGDVPSHLRETITALDSAKVALLQYRIYELNIQ